MRRGLEREHVEERMDSTIKADSKEEREGMQEEPPKRGRRKHERVSGRKSSSGRSAESWLHSQSGQT